jgi:hypothetical protein
VKELRITLNDGAVYILPTVTIIAIKIFRGDGTYYDNHEIDFSKIKNIEMIQSRNEKQKISVNNKEYEVNHD